MKTQLWKVIEKRLSSKNDIKKSKIDSRDRAIITRAVEFIVAKKVKEIKGVDFGINNDVGYVVPHKSVKKHVGKNNQTNDNNPVNSFTSCQRDKIIFEGK